MTYTLRFTADVVKFTDDNRIIATNGWYAPKFSRTLVSPDVEYADTFTFDTAEELAALLREYLNGIEEVNGETIYSADAVTYLHENCDVRVAAHVEETDVDLLPHVAFLITGALDILDAR